MSAAAFSVFEGGLAKIPFGSASPLEIVEAIRSGRIGEIDFSRKVHAIRDCQGDKDRADTIKKTLPAFSASVACATRAADATPEEKQFVHTGRLQCDFDGKDHPDWNMNEKYLELTEDPHVETAFVTPSGFGIKAILWIPADLERHRDSWQAAADYFLTTYGLKVDKSTKDPIRLCFFSHDPNAYFNPKVEVLDIEKWFPVPAKALPMVEKTGRAGVNGADTVIENPPGWIVLPSNGIGYHESAATAFAAMSATGRFFLRGGAVVEIRNSELDVLKPDALRSAAETCGVPIASWQEKKDKKDKRALVPGEKVSADVAKVWLASSARLALPEIKSIQNVAPMRILANGQLVISCPGYHSESCTLVTGAEVPNANISHQEALDAINLLFAEFEFAKPSDKSRAVAMLITPALVAGGLLAGHIPIFIVEGPGIDGSQTGKGFMCEVNQTVYGELASLVTPKDGGVGGFDESLAAALVGGRMFIQLDNLRGRLASMFFEMVLTCPRGSTVACRTPHRPEIAVDPARVIFCGTSNGLEMTPDLANRACVIRIKKRSGWNPPTFPEGGLIEHVAANRERFLGAVYYIAAVWYNEGRHRTEDSRAPGRFRAWGQTLDWIVQELVGCAPLLDGHQEIQTRVSNPGLGWLREVAVEIVRHHGDRDEPWTASNLMELSEEIGVTIPGCKEYDERASRKIGILLAGLFKSGPTVDADGVTVTRDELVIQRTGGGAQTLKAYRFCSQKAVSHQPAPTAPMGT